MATYLVGVITNSRKGPATLRGGTVQRDYDLAPNEPAYADGILVLFREDQSYLKRTARDVRAVADLVDTEELLGLVDSNDPKVREVAMARIVAVGTPEMVASAFSGRGNRDGLMAAINALVARGAEWLEEFELRLDSDLRLRFAPIRAYVATQSASGGRELVVALRLVEALDAGRVRDRLTVLAMERVHTRGGWGPIASTFAGSPISVFAEHAQEATISTVKDSAALRRYLTEDLGELMLAAPLQEQLARRVREGELPDLLEYLSLRTERVVSRAAVSALFASGREEAAVAAVKNWDPLPNDLFDLLPRACWWDAEWRDQVPYVRVREAIETANAGPWPAGLVETLIVWLKRCPSQRIRRDAKARLGEGANPYPLGYLLHSERERLCDALPDELLMDERLLPFAVARAVVRRGYMATPAPESWGKFPVSVRLVWIHRAFWGGDGLAQDHPARGDPDPLVQAGIRLYVAMGRNQSDRIDVVETFDRTLREHLMTVASDASAPPIDLRPILPDCLYAERGWSDSTPNVAHCEGRMWAAGQRNLGGDKDWCPRIPGGCPKLVRFSPTLVAWSLSPYGGRTEPVPTLPWEWASLTEVFPLVGALPSPEGLRNTDHYVTAVGGYANRMNEIRERLVCRACNTRLEANFEYARNPDAKYNKTFFTCPRGHDHYPYPGRYFNHCWCCERVIDSDESPIQERRLGIGRFAHGMYLCAWCGAGDQPSKNGRCTIGERCPKCGIERRMELIKSFLADQITLRCGCGHEIVVPQRAIKNALTHVDGYLPPYWWDQNKT
jgi:hypothetical protein